MPPSPSMTSTSDSSSFVSSGAPAAGRMELCSCQVATCAGACNEFPFLSRLNQYGEQVHGDSYLFECEGPEIRSKQMQTILGTRSLCMMGQQSRCGSTWLIESISHISRASFGTAVGPDHGFRSAMDVWKMGSICLISCGACMVLKMKVYH